MSAADRRSDLSRRRRFPRRVRGRLTFALLRWLLLIGLAVGLVGLLWGLHLDRVVRAKFEGHRWALPARVHARPLELFTGRQLTPTQLEQELKRLTYRQTADPATPGTYRREGSRFSIHIRPFRYWDGFDPAQRVTVTFADGVISELSDETTGVDPWLVRLDPMLIANIYPTHNEDRILVRRAEIPPLLIGTLLAVEDRSFFRHHGVDPRGILRAAYANLRAGAVVEGASTLTQQLVKNFYLTAERSFERKLNEAMMAILLELHYSKDDILEAYVNEIYLGQDGSRAIHGFGLASQFYFSKPLNELDIPEMALLVGLVQAPSSLDPRRRAEASQRRRDLVIDRMLRDQVITAAQAAAAKTAPLGIVEGGGRPVGDYPSFMSLVRRQLQRDYRDEDLRSEGLNIFTTLDPLIQETVEGAVPKRLAELEASRRMRSGTLEAAAVVTSVAQAEVLALVGGRSPSFAGFNRALDSSRSIGSLVKPAIYLAALSKPDEYSVATRIADSPVNRRLADGKIWSPQNYDRKSRGMVPLHEALSSSLNLATVNLGFSIGLDEIVDTLHQLGAQRRIPQVPAIMLGAIPLSPLEVTQMYQTIAAGGFRTPLRAIREVVDNEGRPLNRYPLAVEAVIDPRAAYLTTWTMQRVVTHGTARWLGNQLPEGMTMAGKTGTTDEMRDSWYAGYSGDKVAVVWVGRDDYQPMGLAGGAGALRVWGDFMLEIANEPLPETLPEGIVLARICGSGSPLPVMDGHTPAGCGRGGGEGGTAGSRADADAAPETDTPAAGDPEPTPPARPPQRQRNLFLENF